MLNLLRPITLLILAVWPLCCTATTITIIYANEDGSNMGIYNQDPVTPLPDNPGTTLGEQRRIAHEYAARLAERVVWIPNSTPVESLVRWEALADFIGAATVRYLISDPEPRLGNKKIAWPLLLRFAQGHTEHTTLNIAEGDSDATIRYDENYVFDYSLTPVKKNVSHLVTTALHEHIHHLGIASALRGIKDREEDKQFISLYDARIRLANDPTPSYEMTIAQLNEWPMAMKDDARFTGGDTVANAGMLLTAGQDAGEVFLHTASRGRSALSHLSFSVQPVSLMAPSSGETLDLSIVAHMLADINWGPVVDSMVAASSPAPGQVDVDVTADLMRSALGMPATNLVVTLQPPADVMARPVAVAPATCGPVTTTGQPVVCEYASLAGTGKISYSLSGDVGDMYEVKVDVDHQAMHVDPLPANNFAALTVEIAADTLEGVTLSSQSVQENQPMDTEVGAFIPQNSEPNVTHSFMLATGGMHNSCFRIDGDRLLTTIPFD
ncbi:MAG: hypothetical protein ACR2PJ_04870, partial [Pseudomonadales bacterium]